jgi:hypothetical protein
MQGSGGCISRSFAEPAVHALAEMRQQLQSRSDECCKLLEDIETVLQLLKETSIAIVDDDEGECAAPEGLDQVQPESSVELEEI